MVGFTMVMEPEQRDFLEVYRRQQGLYSIADSARELIHLGIQLVGFGVFDCNL